MFLQNMLAEDGGMLLEGMLAAGMFRAGMLHAVLCAGMLLAGMFVIHDLVASNITGCVMTAETCPAVVANISCSQS